MRTLIARIAPLACLWSLLWAAAGLAQNPTPDDATAAAPEATPKGEPPMAQPPPPPATLPAPPVGAQTPSVQAPELGQWIYTSQYGWVWVPYGDDYVYTPADDAAEPFVFLFYPGYGWGWYAAPWIWGVGPLPYFGAAGPWRFHWYRGPAYHRRTPERPLFRGGYGSMHTGEGRAGGHGVEHHR